MKKSSSERYTTGDYEKNHPDWHAEDASWKAGMVAAAMKKQNIQPKRITEIGCGSGGILKVLAQVFPGTAAFEGFDISPRAIALAQQGASNGVYFFCDDLLQRPGYSTDLLLVLDVLEHVDDFYGMLRDIHFMSGQFIFHIPLDLSCRTLLKPHVLLEQRERSGHVHYFSEEMVRWALHDTGFEIVEWEYTQPRIDIDPARGLKNGVKKILRNLSFGINRKWSVKLWGGYSILIFANRVNA